MPTCGGIEFNGSSPLARGLQREGNAGREPGGIIPARAGFTTGGHQQLQVVGGSSPLARGLRPGAQGLGEGSRIIPARAGFTPWAESPRVVRAGSSPLARGLREVGCSRQLALRIIPARAGFTSSASSEEKRTPDHPRSRGVYWASVLPASSAAGSSPLARGLRRRRPTKPVGRRIIPARAGFTRRALSAWLSRRDHPRSRGVYCRPLHSRSAPAGSSPLARGLLVGVVQADHGIRIIPARAGFTSGSPLALSPGPDHPRSRGVYSTTASAMALRPGSSPLARGLPSPRGSRAEVLRIIPARAGFTPPTPPTNSRTPDHPRSRGVYIAALVAALAWFGSSPLARGLHRPDNGAAPQRRIIPARAGFTCAWCSMLASRGDHPRSRGVYTCGS